MATIGNNLTRIIQVAGSATTINNTLTSTSTTAALSANQGKVLNEADILSGAVVGTNLELTLKGVLKLQIV